MPNKIELVEGFVIHRVKGRVPKSNSKYKPKRKYLGQKDLCTIKVNPIEYHYLKSIWKRSGLTCLEVFYRGLGMRRVKKIKKLTGMLEFYRKENSL